MLRLWLVALFFLSYLHACPTTSNSCVQKVIDANAVVGDTLSIPVASNKRVIYSKRLPKEKVIKHDPFLGLYLVEDSSSFPYDFEFNAKLSLPKGVVDKNSYLSGKVLRPQLGLGRLGLFSKPHKTPALLLNSCCYLYGLATPEGIIDKEYLEHFLSLRGGLYGDIGLRVTQRGSGVFAEAVDPFFANNPFKKEDQILLFDGKKVSSAALLMRQVLFAKIGSLHTLRVKRHGKVLDLRVKVAQRHGGGLLSDTFLESQGIYFTPSLTIASVSGKFADYGLKKGDKLLWVNSKPVYSHADLRKRLESNADLSSLLFERDGFQFFVNIK